MQEALPWWQDAVIYQVYPRSFADGNADGTGDLIGVRQRLDHLVDLGVDALWLSPFYRSPQVDHGYDVADHCDVDPLFGSLADFDALLAAAHARGLRVLTDLVPNHSSDQHPWFQAALAAGPGAPERARYLFRDGRGPDGSWPPTDVASTFGGPAWTRVVEPDGRPGQWYFHLYAPEQPDFDWTHPDVGDEFERILRFWLDRGVDGFRVDVADALAKHPDLRGDDPAMDLIRKDARSPLHAVYQRWRRILDAYAGERILILETADDPEIMPLLVRPDQADLAFNFPFMRRRAWSDEEPLRQAVDRALWLRGATGRPAAWVTDNHDNPRSVTRFGEAASPGDPADIALGTRRARAMALVLLTLPGAAVLYNGQELGLPNVDDLPEDLLQDPVWVRSGGTDRGRDGCRIPLPWSDAEPPFGFSGPGVRSWLPQPAAWADLTAAAQAADEQSMLGWYRHLLALRRAEPALRTGAVCWLPTPPHALAYERMSFAGTGARPAVFEVWVNLAADPLPIPTGEVVAASSSVVGVLPPDTAVLVRTRT